tara:strand:+ start:2554 stop:3114 length:561 start_codon:yes stop_codon:yes gene_type:complete
MSFFVQTNKPEFAPSENAKMRKAVHAVMAANRFQKTHSQSTKKTWYVNGIKRDRKGYADALVNKNKLTVSPTDYKTGDKSWSIDNGLASFCDRTKLNDYVDTIPGMTYGLMYVLSLLDIHFVSQMLVEFIKNITDEDEEGGTVADMYYKWLKSVAKGTIAEETNMHTVTYAMTMYVENKGLYSWPI